jgi:hypothetical protein
MAKYHDDLLTSISYSNPDEQDNNKVHKITSTIPTKKLAYPMIYLKLTPIGFFSWQIVFALCSFLSGIPSYTVGKEHIRFAQHKDEPLVKWFVFMRQSSDLERYNWTNELINLHKNIQTIFHINFLWNNKSLKCNNLYYIFEQNTW